MKLRRLAWGLWLVFALLLYLFENNTGTRILLAAGVLVPVFSLVCARLASVRLRLVLETPESCRKGEEGICTLRAKKSRLLFFSVLSAEIIMTNLLSTQENKQVIRLSGNAQAGRAFGVSSDACGTLRLSCGFASVGDVFGLFSFPAQAFETRYISVPSELLSVTLNIAESSALSENSERWSQSRAGSDPSETFAIREYVPGDPIRQIHWKLSQKSDKLMIRELGLPVSDDILLLLETSVAEDRPWDTPAAAEALLSVSAELLEEALPHRIAWRSGRHGEFIMTQVENAEDEKNAAARMLTAEGFYGDESVAQAFLKNSERFYAHTAVFSARPDTDVVSLTGAGRVSLLLPKSVAASSAYGDIHVNSFPYAGKDTENFFLEL